MRRIFRLSTNWIMLFIAFYSILPIWGSFAQWNIKDVLFTVVFVLYLLALCLYSKDPQFKRLFLMLGAALLVGLFRKNGMFVVWLSSPFALLASPSNRRLITSGVIVLTMLMIPLFAGFLAGVTNASSGSISEALSVPFQQTARYAQMHPEDVTEEERKVIDKVLDYEAMVESYRPSNSDPVRRTFRNNTEALVDYMKVWIDQGLRHPGTYVEALVLNSYYYWFPSTEPLKDPLFALFGIDTPESLSRYLGDDAFKWEAWQDSEERNEHASVVRALRSVPFVNVLCHPGIYSWLIVFLFALALKNRYWRYSAPYIACLVLFLTCIASPVNGYFRYCLGYVASMPILFGYLIYLIREDKARGFVDRGHQTCYGDRLLDATPVACECSRSKTNEIGGASRDENHIKVDHTRPSPASLHSEAEAVRSNDSSCQGFRMHTK